jgi:hypothetical protein
MSGADDRMVPSGAGVALDKRIRSTSRSPVREERFAQLVHGEVPWSEHFLAQELAIAPQ